MFFCFSGFCGYAFVFCSIFWQFVFAVFAGFDFLLLWLGFLLGGFLVGVFFLFFIGNFTV